MANDEEAEVVMRREKDSLGCTPYSANKARYKETGSYDLTKEWVRNWRVGYCGVVRVDTSPSALPRKDDSGDCRRRCASRLSKPSTKAEEISIKEKK